MIVIGTKKGKRKKEVIIFKLKDKKDRHIKQTGTAQILIRTCQNHHHRYRYRRYRNATKQPHPHTPEIEFGIAIGIANRIWNFKLNIVVVGINLILHVYCNSPTNHFVSNQSCCRVFPQSKTTDTTTKDRELFFIFDILCCYFATAGALPKNRYSKYLYVLMWRPNGD